MGSLPVGNGYFIWMLSRCEGGDPKKLAQMAKAAGLSYVTIKVADGPYIFNWDKANQKDLIGPAVDALRADGIGVWGWSYVYGNDPDGEARMAARQVLNYDLDGYMIDAESEYKKKPEQAKRLFNVLRMQLPNKPLGICAFRFPSYHMDFPWASFAGCDFNMPQVYWMMAHNAGQQLYRSYTEFSKLPGYQNMPFVPVGAAFSEWCWTAQVAEVADFRAMAAKLNLDGTCWWEWYDATVRHPELWKASTDGSVVTPPKDPVLFSVMTRFTNLRMRSGPSLTANILGYMPPNQKFGIVEVQGTWVRLAGADPRWVSLTYCVKL